MRENDAALASIRHTIDFDEFADREPVLAAGREDEQVKAEVFAILDKMTQRPHRVIGVHSFNPVPRLPFVEIIPSLFTDGTRSCARKRLSPEFSARP